MLSSGPRLLQVWVVRLVMWENADGSRRLEANLVFGIGIVGFFCAALLLQDLVFAVRMVDFFWAALLPQVILVGGEDRLLH